ncbi:hypothetical protein V5F40_06705 [Xanthobacter sp. DSM 14520]|uniref:hypothetical protein n=1 Tax=Xanthobacter autotrophicus (strain ATCC BAA-1158 / Py2) TaxID=78245 RepID=UPI00372C1508
MTKREAVLVAFHAALVAGLAPTEVRRNAIVPQRVPPAGFAILRDGEAGDPESLMSPPSWYFEHRAEIEIVVDGADEAARTASLDALVAQVGAVIATDRTLSGACDYVQGYAPSSADVPVESGAPLSGATIPVVLVYVSTDPLA